MTGPAGRFELSTRVGSAADLHGAAVDIATGARPRAAWLEVTAPALVIGSAQPIAHIDLDACARGSVTVVRRRSGGGAVLVVPGEMVWLDVVVASDDPCWNDDVGRAMWWLGDVWAEALTACGVTDVAVHHGAVQHTAWSRQVCFDGLGGGEVSVGGAKLVGISQRRTRGWARLQSAAHVVWRGDEMVEMLAAPRPAPGELGRPAVLDADLVHLRAALAEALSAR